MDENTNEINMFLRELTYIQVSRPLRCRVGCRNFPPVKLKVNHLLKCPKCGATWHPNAGDLYYVASKARELLTQNRG